MLQIITEYKVLDAFWLTIQLALLSAVGALLIGIMLNGMTILDVSTGTDVATDLSANDVGLPTPAGGAAFSPDRTQLALWGPWAEPAQQLVIIDVPTGAVRLATDLPLRQGDLGNNSVTWSPDSTRLFALSGDGGTLGTINTSTGESVLLQTSSMSADALVAVASGDGPPLGATDGAPPCGDQLLATPAAPTDCLLGVTPER